MDLVMLVHYGGRERTLDELRALAGAHGLTVESVRDLNDERCLLELRPGP